MHARKAKLAEAIDELTGIADTIRSASLECWSRPVLIIGRHPSIGTALERLARFAASDSPVLITGESGTGKELFARALYLLSRRRGRPFLTVNCPQYQEGNIVASQMFGYARGSFTGAASDREGVFEAADGGVVFLDEIGDLTLQTQAMLLRVLSEGEVVRVGETAARRVDARVVAATNRDLAALAEAGQFRFDLYYRMGGLHIHVPPVRERGEDLELLLEHQLRTLGAACACAKSLSPDARRLLAGYHWPGNVREVKALIEASFHLATGDTIHEREVAHVLEAGRTRARTGPASEDRVAGNFARLVRGEGNFWDLVHAPFIERELSRADAREIVARGLAGAGGSYKRLLATFGVADGDYMRFMDFLRHHRLKPANRE